MIIKTTSRKMALKPYLESVKEHCQGLSKEELVETLLGLAQEAPVSERADFLDKIQAFASKPRSKNKKAVKDFAETLLEQIAALREEIEERSESIENGDYWEDGDHWDERDYDEGPDHASPEQIEELENLFLETGGVFLDGKLETACRLYQALFALLDEEEEVLNLLPDSLDLREERARYCRCLYETADPKQRVQSVLDCISVDGSINHHRLDLPSERRPMLQDIMDARQSELADWEKFLPAWEKRLAHHGSDRAAVLRLEAIQKLKGVEGVSELAREWKSGQPRGYLFWIQCLEKEGDLRGMLDACREALDALPKDRLREQAAQYFTVAAAQLGETEYVLQGKRERFLSSPGERNLLELLGEAARRSVRLPELNVVIASMDDNTESLVPQEDLRSKMLLMAGRLNEAFDETQNEKSLGWSNGKAGVVFASILSVLTKNSSKAVVIRDLLELYTERRDFYDYDDDDVVVVDSGGAKVGALYKEILTGLKSVKVEESEARKYRTWAENIARTRIEAIVSGKHRTAYDRAARVLAALAEYYLLANETEKASSLLHEFVFLKFPRHNAFRKEVKTVAARSPLIRGLQVI